LFDQNELVVGMAKESSRFTMRFVVLLAWLRHVYSKTAQFLPNWKMRCDLPALGSMAVNSSGTSKPSSI
jgi:hypothetical protein